MKDQPMDINKGSATYNRIHRAVMELKMSKKPVTLFKVAEMTGIDRMVIFQYFYEEGLLRGK